MKINLLLCVSLFCGSLLTAQCPLEKQLIGRWVWANTAEIVAVFQFNEDKTVDLHAANDLLKDKTKIQWTLLPDCSLVMKNHLNPEDASSIEFTNEGLLAITTKPKKDEFGLTFPSNKIFLKRLSNDNQALTQYLNGLKKSYPEIHYAMKHKEERAISQRIYANQYEIETRKRDSLAGNAAAAAAVQVGVAAAMEESKMEPATLPDVPTAEATVVPQPPLTDEMKKVVLKGGNGEPEWILHIKDGYAEFYAADADMNAMLTFRMSQYTTQSIDNAVVKLLQFQDVDATNKVLTVMVSENGKKTCNRSDGSFKYSLNVIFQNKKYIGCGQ